MIAKFEHRGKEPRELFITRQGTVRDASVNQQQTCSNTLRFAKQVWPDFGFEDDDDSGPETSQHTPHSPDVVEWRIEDASDAESFESGFVSGKCTRADEDGGRRTALPEFLNERNGSQNLAY